MIMSKFIEYGEIIVDLSSIQCAKIVYANDYSLGGTQRKKESIYAYFKNGMSITIFASDDESVVEAEFQKLKKLLNNLS